VDRKKELKELYKQIKPDMGAYIIRSNFSNKYYIESTKDIKSALNSTKFKLEAGIHPNRELQNDWNEHGETGFTIEVLEKLKYDKDESKTDYSEELAILKMVWEEKLQQKGMELYKK